MCGRPFRGVVAVAAAALLLSGCSTTPPSPPVNESVKFFNAPKQPTEPPPEQLPAVRLYVDDSESMKGYVAVAGGNGYKATIERLLERLAASQYPLEATGVSSGEKSLQSVQASQLLSPGFYSGADTPLSKVVGEMAASVEGGKIAILVSDMVQSDPLHERTDMIRALARLSSGEILLIGSRSGFHGKYFPETYAKKPFDLNLPDDEEKGRPFYFLISAPTAAVMQKFRDKILTPAFENRKVQMFAPSTPAVSFDQEWKVLGIGKAPSAWSRGTKAALVPGTRGVLWESFTHQGGAAAESPLRIESKASIRAPLRDFSRLGYLMERGTFKSAGKDGKRGPGEARERLEGRPECEIQNADPKADKKWVACGAVAGLSNGEYVVRLTFPFATPAMNTWDVYHLKVTAGDGNLRPPEWITAWSTSSDQETQDGNKTLYLEVLGESLVNGISENVVILDRLIHLGRF
jgi:hypothetical protein